MKVQILRQPDWGDVTLPVGAVVDMPPFMARELTKTGEAVEAPKSAVTQSLLSGDGVGGYYDLFCWGATMFSLECAKEAMAMGMRVIIVDAGNHVGGMFTGGISATDISYTEFSGQVGGNASEILRACADEKGMSYEAFFRGAATVEPKVAAKVMQRRIAAAGIKVVKNSPLVSVRKGVSDSREGMGAICGNYSFTFGHWYDGSYEGDFLRAMGCSYAYGREANATYGETLAGVQAYGTTAQFADGVDPYITPGVPSSGPLPFATEDAQGTAGSASTAVMAPCYRLLVCKSGGTGYTKVPMQNASNYNALNYELLGRHFAQAASGASSWTDITSKFLYVNVQGTNKNDLNSGSLPQSTNWINPTRWRNEYVFGTTDSRKALCDEIWDYTLGLFQFLRTDTRLSAAARADAALIGWASDEFVSTGGRPPIIYPRETIRLVGDTVTTDKDGLNARAPADGVASWYYRFDSHHARRIYVPGVGVKNEGYLDNAVITPFNEIPFSVMRPKLAESTNGLVGYCISVSRAAFTSLRMEPILWQLAQAAGRAFGIAFRNGIKVSQVSGADARAEVDRWKYNLPGALTLSADGTTYAQGTVTTFGAAWSQGVAAVGEAPHQVSSQGATITGSVTGTALAWASTTAGTLGTPTGLIVEGPGIPYGTTIVSGTSPNFVLSNSATVAGGTTMYLRAAKKFTFNVPASEPKDVWVRFVVRPGSARSSAAVFDYVRNGVAQRVTLNQNSGGEGGDWVLAFRGVQFQAGSPSLDAIYALTDAAGGPTVIAAVELRKSA